MRYKIYDLGVLANRGSSWAWGLNTSGTVAGGGNAAFTWSESSGLKPAGPLFHADQNSTFYCINDAGAAAGNVQWWVNGRLRQLQTCYWSPSKGFQLIPFLPGRSQGQAYGINNLGQVVGDMFPSEQAFYWSPQTGTVNMGRFHPDFGGLATDINDLGEACGTTGVLPPPGFGRAFRWTLATGLEDLGVLPSFTESFGEAINNEGEIVGTCFKSGTEVTFRKKRGEAMVNALPAFLGYVNPFDLNDQGWFVGTGHGIQGQFVAVCPPDGSVIDVAANAEGGTAGLKLIMGTGINESGDVCGIGLTASNLTRGFFAKRID